MESAITRAQDHAVERPDLYQKIFWRIMPLIVFAYVGAYLDRVNVGFAKLKMLDDLGFSDAVYGLGAGIFFLGCLLSKSFGSDRRVLCSAPNGRPSGAMPGSGKVGLFRATGRMDTGQTRRVF
jgi:hypothetical protein